MLDSKVIHDFPVHRGITGELYAVVQSFGLNRIGTLESEAGVC